MPIALSDSAVATTADGPTVLIGGAGLAATRTVLQTRTISTSSIAAPSAETLKDPPISTPFVQHLSPGGGPTPVRRQAPDRRPRQQPAAGPQPERQRHVDVPVAEAPRSPRALLLPRRRLLGARRPRDPRERGRERRPGRDRVPEREDAVDLRPPAGRRLLDRATRTSPTTSTPTPAAAWWSRTRRTAGCCSSIRRATRADRSARPGTAPPGCRRRSDTRTARPRCRTATSSSRRSTERASVGCAPTRRSTGRTTVPGLHTPSDPQPMTDGSTLVVDYAHPGAVIRFSPSGKVLWTYRPTSGSGVLDHPSLGAPLPNGLIAVNDDYNDRVVLIDPRHEQHRLPVRPHRRRRHRPGLPEHPRWPGPPAPRRRHPAPRRLRQPEGPRRPSVTQS